MIKITKRESKLIEKYFPYVHINKTKHKCYMEENGKALSFLKITKSKE